MLRRLAFGLAGGLLVLTVVAQALSPLLALRLRFWEQRSWYGSMIEPTADARVCLRFSIPAPAVHGPSDNHQHRCTDLAC